MRRAGAVTAVAAVLVATACSELPGDLYATDADVARAVTVWSDPWLAPERLSVQEAAWGSNGLVNRDVASRRTRYAGVGPATAVRSEVAVATATGWTLVGATCTEAEVRAVLTRDGGDLDRASLAEVEAADTDGPREGYVDVDVVAVAPHHLDEDWPEPGSAVPLAESCLTGGPSGDVPELSGRPRGDADDDVDPPEWSDDQPSDADESRWDALAADPWFAAVAPGAAFEPDTAAGDTRRNAPAWSGTLRPGPPTAASAVRAVTAEMDGWVLTYTSCGPHTGVVATLRLDTTQGPVVTRLATDPLQPRAVRWTVRLPVVEGPDQSWVDDVPELGTATCLASAGPPRRPVVEGVPVGLVEELQAMQ